MLYKSVILDAGRKINLKQENVILKIRLLTVVQKTHNRRDLGLKPDRRGSWFKISHVIHIIQSTTFCGGGRSLSNRSTTKIAHHRVHQMIKPSDRKWIANCYVRPMQRL